MMADLGLIDCDWDVCEADERAKRLARFGEPFN
jgi:hypothetical protein